MSKRTSGKNLPKVEKMLSVACLTCWNDEKFDITGIERIESDGWNVLFQCPYCLTSFTFQYCGFAFEDQLRDHLKKIIGNQKIEQPTSYREWDLRTGKVYRDSHPNGLYEEITI